MGYDGIKKMLGIGYRPKSDTVKLVYQDKMVLVRRENGFLQTSTVREKRKFITLIEKAIRHQEKEV